MLKVEEVVGKIVAEWIKELGFEAESAGRLVFIAPKGFLNKLRIKTALFLFPRETMVMGIPDFGSQPRDQGFLRRLGIQAFPQGDAHARGKQIAKCKTKNLQEKKEQEHKSVTFD